MARKERSIGQALRNIRERMEFARTDLTKKYGKGLGLFIWFVSMMAAFSVLYFLGTLILLAATLVIALALPDVNLIAAEIVVAAILFLVSWILGLFRRRPEPIDYNRMAEAMALAIHQELARERQFQQSPEKRGPKWDDKD